MTKKEAISIISRCATLYAFNLCDRQLAFVYRDSNNRAKFVEVIFRSNNFMHFTGIDTKKHNKANAFYRDALDKRLKESDIQFKNNHTTELKLQILHSIMNIPFSARMIGDYTGAHLDLYTEKVAGTTTACLGLILHKNEYIPNTILKEDIRNIIPKPPGKIFAIFRKSIRQNLYAELTFRSGSIDITKKCLPPDLLKKVDMSLFSPDRQP
jgi:hypothetical protein